MKFASVTPVRLDLTKRIPSINLNSLMHILAAFYFHYPLFNLRNGTNSSCTASLTEKFKLTIIR